MIAIDQRRNIQFEEPRISLRDFLSMPGTGSALVIITADEARMLLHQSTCTQYACAEVIGHMIRILDGGTE